MAAAKHLMEAQRFPDDYDGIVAGAPANFWTHLIGGAAWNNRALLADPSSYISSNKLPAISAAAVAACDAEGRTGRRDYLLSRCSATLIPPKLKCKETESDSCLTEPQVLP